jgi:hypothetical protein
MPIDDDDNLPLNQPPAPFNDDDGDEDNYENGGDMVMDRISTFFQNVEGLPITDERLTDDEALALQARERAAFDARRGGDVYDDDGNWLGEREPAQDVDERIPDMDGLDMDLSWAPLSAFPHFENNKFRAFITKLFSNYTQTPVEDIFRIQGCPVEVDVWLAANTTSKGIQTVDFSRLAPGAASMVEKFEGDGVGFLKVTDFSGVALYSWRDDPAPRPVAPRM